MVTGKRCEVRWLVVTSPARSGLVGGVEAVGPVEAGAAGVALRAEAGMVAAGGQHRHARVLVAHPVVGQPRVDTATVTGQSELL